jgi:hypothetical protein
MKAILTGVILSPMVFLATFILFAFATHIIEIGGY